MHVLADPFQHFPQMIGCPKSLKGEMLMGGHFIVLIFND
jgi:hypothetical protein